MKDKEKILKNKQLCEKYPFLTWHGNPLFPGYSEQAKIDFSYTWEDELEPGWRRAFCPQIWDDLKIILEKADFVDKFRFSQIKEKWGLLTIYHEPVSSEIFEEILDWELKYEHLSEKVCINCGEPATKMTLGWISFFCDNCINSISSAIPVEDIDEYYKDPDVYFKKHFKK